MLVETPMRIQEAIHSCGHIDRMHARNNPSGYVFALWLPLKSHGRRQGWVMVLRPDRLDSTGSSFSRIIRGFTSDPLRVVAYPG